MRKVRVNYIKLHVAMQDDDNFAAAVRDAREIGGAFKLQASDDAFWSRHVEGVNELVFHQGKVVGAIRKYDTPAGKVWMAAHDPRYRLAQPMPMIQDNRSLTIIETAAPAQLAEARALAHNMLMGRASDGGRPCTDVLATAKRTGKISDVPDGLAGQTADDPQDVLFGRLSDVESSARDADCATAQHSGSHPSGAGARGELANPPGAHGETHEPPPCTRLI